MNYRKKVRLGDVLVKKGIIDENQLQTALSRQREQGKMLGELDMLTREILMKLFVTVLELIMLI